MNFANYKALCAAIGAAQKAGNVVNNLCRRYGVPLVCDPDESAVQTAADVARQAAILLLGEEAG